MGKGKGKGKDAQDSLDNCFYTIGMILFVISLVVFIVQLSAGPSTPVEKNTTVTIGNETSIISYSGCSHPIKILDKKTNQVRKEIQNCGGYYTTTNAEYLDEEGEPRAWHPQLDDGIRHPDLCRKKCGVCDPEYDDCFGIKYCSVLCDDGALCNFAVGGPVQPEHCKDIICGANNTCLLFDPIPCPTSERYYHMFMTFVYFSVCLAGVCIYFINIKYLIPNKSTYAEVNPQFYIFWMAIPGGMFFFLSFLFQSVCGSSTVGLARFITMIIVFTISPIVAILFCDKSFKTLVSNSTNGTSSRANVMSLIIWFLFIGTDMMLGLVNSSQAVYMVAEVPIPWFEHIATNKRCSATETYFYVFWTTMMGFVSFAVILLLTKKFSFTPDIDKNGVMTEWGKITLFGTLFSSFIGVPSILFMLINISFLAACKTKGKKIIFEYGIVIVLFYIIILSWQSYVLKKDGKFDNIDTVSTLKVDNNNSSTENVAVENPLEIDEGQAAQGDANVIGMAAAPPPPVARKGTNGGFKPEMSLEMTDVSINDGVQQGAQLEVEQQQQKVCMSSVLKAMLFNFVLFILNGWSTYIVHGIVNKK